MIKARHLFWQTNFFKVYVPLILRWDFSRVICMNQPPLSDEPILLIGNHFSWWDGFIAHHINRKFWKKRFHVMMLEQELSQRMFLNKAGAFSINKGNRSILETMNYTADLLKNPKNLVVIYPQGKIQSLYNRSFSFGKGIRYLTERSDLNFRVVNYLAVVDYFSSRHPALYLYFQDQGFSQNLSYTDIENDFNHFYRACMKQQTELPT
jgi:1-acyl-sn-glycerol-3-phosphate acyltransferase